MTRTARFHVPQLIRLSLANALLFPLSGPYGLLSAVSSGPPLFRAWFGETSPARHPQGALSTTWKEAILMERQL